jgi:hypothetical protein
MTVDNSEEDPPVHKAGNRFAVVIAATVAALAGSGVGAGHASSAAPSPAPIPVVQVASSSDIPVGTTGEAFHTSTARVYMGSASSPYLTGFANADGPIYVDDVLEIR